jgi:Alpha/beta hydrolase family
MAMPWLPWIPAPDLSLRDLPSGVAGDAAFRIFCTPLVSERRPRNYATLAARARFHLRHARHGREATPLGRIATYVFEPDRPAPLGTVLVVHGWTSEASFMTALAEPIRRIGYRVVLFDQPAHGASEGRGTDLISCARATLAIGERFGPIHAVVAHSMGCLATLLAMEGRAPVPRRLAVGHLVLLASPNRLGDVTAHFAAHFGLTAAGQREFERRLERIGRRPLSEVSTARLWAANGGRGLVMHARDDADVAFECAEAIVAGSGGTATLKAFDGLGHRNILFAPPVTRAILAYLQTT